MNYGFPGTDTQMAIKLDVDTERLRRLRTARGWSQEQLAAIADVGERTIQRVEATGKASFATVKAVAAAFDLGPDDLLKRAQAIQPPGESQRKEPVPLFLTRVTTGNTLFNLLGGAHAGEFGHDEVRTEEEMDLVASFLQDMHDYLDIWSDLEEHDKVRARFEYTQRLTELTNRGLWVFVLRRRTRFQVSDNTVENWIVATVQVLHADNPAIIGSVEREAMCMNARE